MIALEKARQGIRKETRNILKHTQQHMACYNIPPPQLLTLTATATRAPKGNPTETRHHHDLPTGFLARISSPSTQDLTRIPQSESSTATSSPPMDLSSSRRQVSTSNPASIPSSQQVQPKISSAPSRNVPMKTPPNPRPRPLPSLATQPDHKSPQALPPEAERRGRKDTSKRRRRMTRSVTDQEGHIVRSPIRNPARILYAYKKGLHPAPVFTKVKSWREKEKEQEFLKEILPSFNNSLRISLQESLHQVSHVKNIQHIHQEIIEGKLMNNQEYNSITNRHLTHAS